MMRLKQALPYGLMIMLGLSVALAAGEFMLRLAGFEFALYPTKVQFGFPDPVSIQRRYEADPELLWVQKNYARKIGLWTGRRPALVFMGCSCTELNRYDEKLIAVIRADHPDQTLSFVNMGVAGWSTYQGLHQLQRDVLPMKPRLITIYYGWNDHWCTFGIEDKNMARYNRAQPAILALFYAKSRVAQLINKAFFSVRFTGLAAQQRVSLEDFGSNLRQMVRLAKAHGITPVLMTAPSSHIKGKEPAHLARRWLLNLSDLVPLHERYVQTVRDVARAEQVQLVDLYQQFRALPAEQLAESFKKDGIHLTEVGDQRIARFMYEALVSSGTLARIAN